jgi:hypothetical protein
VTPTEAARRLRLAEDEYADARAAGLTREAAAYAIAVDVLSKIVVESGGKHTD